MDADRLQAYVLEQLRFWLNRKGHIWHGQRWYIKCLLDVYRAGKMKGLSRKELLDLTVISQQFSIIE